MKEREGEEKLVFSAIDGNLKRYRKVLLIGSGIVGAAFLCLAGVAVISAEWAAVIAFLAVAVIAATFFALACFFDRIAAFPAWKRIEFYDDRIVFWHERAWAWPKMEARYADIRGACINKANEYGDHVKARGRSVEFDVDTLCVYCKRGEYILFGIDQWGEAYSRRILDEILRRADAPESEPEEGEYGGGSQIAEEGFAELGVEEEPLPADDPEEGRFDIEAIVGCELYTESGVHVGKIVRVVPAKTDLYIVERDGREVRLPAEEGVVLGMDVAEKRMTVAAEKFFAAANE